MYMYIKYFSHLWATEALRSHGAKHISNTRITDGMHAFHRFLIPRIARVGKIKFQLFFQGFWPNLGPGRRPLDSDRRDAEFAGVFASIAFLTVSFVPKPIFWNPAEKK